MAETVMSQSQQFALLFEQESARQLLAQGVQLVTSTHLVVPVQDAVLTVWSIGVEKMLKVALGLAAISNGQEWPDMSKRPYRHDLTAMDDQLGQHLHHWLAAEPRSDYVSGLIARVDGDRVWPSLLECLHVYANEGRFHHLDRLAQLEVRRDDPRGLWDAVEQAALAADDDLRTRFFESVTAPVEVHNAVLRELRRAVSSSLLAWWFMVTRLARHRAFGEVGVPFGADSEPGNAMPTVLYDDGLGRLRAEPVG